MTSSRTSSAPLAHRRRSRPRGPARTSLEHGGAARSMRAACGQGRALTGVKLVLLPFFWCTHAVKEMLMRTLVIAALALAASLTAVPLAPAQTPAVPPGPTPPPPRAPAHITSPKADARGPVRGAHPD